MPKQQKTSSKTPNPCNVYAIDSAKAAALARKRAKIKWSPNEFWSDAIYGAYSLNVARSVHGYRATVWSDWFGAWQEVHSVEAGKLAAVQLAEALDAISRCAK